MFEIGANSPPQPELPYCSRHHFSSLPSGKDPLTDPLPAPVAVLGTAQGILVLLRFSCWHYILQLAGLHLESIVLAFPDVSQLWGKCLTFLSKVKHIKGECEALDSCCWHIKESSFHGWAKSNFSGGIFLSVSNSKLQFTALVKESVCLNRAIRQGAFIGCFHSSFLLNSPLCLCQWIWRGLDRHLY